MRPAVSIFPALVLLGLPGVAVAQSTGLTVVPSVRVRYDSNPLRTNDLRSNGPRDDVRVSAGIAFNYNQLLGSAPVFLRGEIGYDKNDRLSFLDRARVLVRTGGTFRFGARCNLRPTASLDLAQTNLDEIGTAAGNTTTTQDYDIGVACNETVGIVPQFSIGHSIRRNSSLFQQRSNRNSDNFRAGIGYVRPSLGRLDLYVAVDSTERPDLLNPGGSTDRTRTTRFGIDASRSVSPRIQARAGVNYIRVTSNQNVPSFDGLGYSGSVRLSPVPRLSITVGASRDAGGSDGFGVTYTIRENYSVSAAITIGARTRLTLSSGRSDRTFRGEDLVAFPIARGNERLTTVAATLGYDLTQKLRINADVSYRKRVSQNNFYSYSSASVGLSIGGKF
jgi:hypothetical protein